MLQNSKNFIDGGFKSKINFSKTYLAVNNNEHF